MKKHIFLLSLLALLAASCTYREELPEGGNGLVPAEITAVSSQTRTSLAGKNVLWNDGDAISVFTDAGTVHQFTTPKGGASATFTGSVDHYATKVSALYPYDAAATFADGLFTATLASSQKAVRSGFDTDLAIMTAQGELSDYKCELAFNQACALVKVTATSAVSSIELACPKGTLVAGSAKVSPELENPLAVKAASNVVLSAGGEGNLEAGDYLFTVFPFEAKDCRIIYHVGNQTKTKTLDISVSRASVFSVDGSDADLEPDPYMKTAKVNDTVIPAIATDLFEGDVDMPAVSSFNVYVDDVPYGFLSFSGAGGLGNCNSEFSSLPWYNRGSAQTGKSSVDYFTGRAAGTMVENGGNKFYVNLASEVTVHFRIDLRGTSPLYYMELVKVEDPGVVFHEDFDLCVCGGDYTIAIAGTSNDATKTGYEAGKKNGNTANQPGCVFDYPVTVEPADKTPVASDAYIAAKGLTGWEFKYAGERPGALQLCSGGIEGFMVTPPLSSLTGATDVTIEIDIARFSSTSTDPIKVILSGGGMFTDGSVMVEAYAAAGKASASTTYANISSDTFTIGDDEYCPHSIGNNDKDKPHSYYTLHATGVTPSTRIRIDAKKGATNAPRCFVFDIKVTK